MIRFTIPYLPPMTNRSMGQHWGVTARERKKWRDWVNLFAKPKPRKPYEKAHVTITRASSKRPDEDGLVSAGKHIIDALTYHGIIVDDSPDHLTRSYEWEKAPPKKGRVTVTVEAM